MSSCCRCSFGSQVTKKGFESTCLLLRRMRAVFSPELPRERRSRVWGGLLEGEAGRMMLTSSGGAGHLAWWLLLAPIPGHPEIFCQGCEGQYLLQ